MNGHKGKRDISRYQADSMANEVFQSIFTCIECGSIMSLMNTDVGRHKAEYTFICPIHGPQRREIPAFYHTAITGLQGTMNFSKSILDSLSCPRCGEVFVLSEISEKKGILEIKARCSNGHKEMRFIPKIADESVLKTTIKRLIHCDDCGLPCQVLETEPKGNKARVELACPAHGKKKKELPVEYAWMLESILEAMSEGSIVRSMLNCRDCGNSLSIKSVELDKMKYKLKCSCINGHSIELSQPSELDEEAIDAIVGGVLKCNDCNLVTSIVETKVSGNDVEMKLVCPIHGDFKKNVCMGIYKHVEERDKQIDRMPSTEESLKCEKCTSPMTIRDTKVRDDIVELKMECRNGHGTERHLHVGAIEPVVERFYQQLYECHKCHNPLTLLTIEDKGGKSEAIVTCENHGESRVEIPTAHAATARDAYLSIKTLADVEKLLETRLQTERAAEYQIEADADVQEMLDIVNDIIEQQSVRFIGEKSGTKNGEESWYYGKALAGTEYVVIGSVSKDNLTMKISVSSDDENKMNLLLSEMRDNLREVLLRLQAKTGDLAPKKIECAQCGAALPKRALPGETVICDHCGTPLHWG
jgi:transcription elongation factor Elf1